jgi:hypothetical protein
MKNLLILFLLVLSGCYRCAGKSGYSAYCFDDDSYQGQNPSCYYRITIINLSTGKKEYKVVKDIDSAIYYYNAAFANEKCEERTFKKMCKDNIVLLEVDMDNFPE